MNIGAGIIIVSKDTKRILLTRRSDSGAWANFGGGMQDFETVYQCAVRELSEETGLVNNIDYKILGTRPTYTKATANWTYYMYVALSDYEVPVKLNEENTEYGWYNLDDLPSPLHYGVDEVLNSKQIRNAIERILK